MRLEAAGASDPPYGRRISIAKSPENAVDADRSARLDSGHRALQGANGSAGDWESNQHILHCECVNDVNHFPIERKEKSIKKGKESASRRSHNHTFPMLPPHRADRKDREGSSPPG